MRICLVASARFPVAEPFAGGLEAHTHELARRLAARGHAVTLFAAPGSDPALGVRTLPVRPFASSAAARADVGATPEEWMREHHAYLGLMLDLAADGGFDVVQNSSLHHLPVAMTPLLDVPVVTTLHTPPLGWLESAVALASPRAVYVAVSEAMRRAWAHCADATVIPNGVDTAGAAAGPGGPRAVWSGRIVPEKGPHEAVAAAHAAGMAIDVAGPVTDPGYFAGLVRPALGPRDRYLGHLTQRELHAVLGRAGVAVVTPRWDEPFGLVAAEALRAGTPVAAYASGALPEIVTADVGRLAQPGDVAGLGRAIVAARGLSRAACRARAARHFDAEVMAARYEALYRSVVSR